MSKSDLLFLICGARKSKLMVTSKTESFKAGFPLADFFARSKAAIVSKTMHAYGKRFSMFTGEFRRQNSHYDRPRHSLKMDKRRRLLLLKKLQVLKLLLLEDQKANKKDEEWFLVRHVCQARKEKG